jgi:putative holliday junction resolvase
MRYLGIDYGTRRTGIALGDSESRLALPFEAFEALTNKELAHAIADLARREAITQIVIGLPLNADGTVSGQSKITEEFIALLEQELAGRGVVGGEKVTVHRASEYLSTHEAEGKLAGHYTRLQKRARVDALAAARILQDWMDAHAPQPPAAG